jgi:two-component SAPR family response regulator
MAEQIRNIAKITKPNTVAVVSRKRLFNRLNKGIKKPLLWLSAPAGSGKTTLVSSYLDNSKLPCIWYQIDEGDSDLATFFYYMGLAAKKAAPRYRKPLPLLTPEYMLGIPTFTRRYFESLCTRLKTPFAIVLDNYQEAPEQSGIHDIITNGIDALPHGITMIVLSRVSPPAQYARLRANDCAELIDRDEIKFTIDEAKEIINLRSREKISEDVLNKFYEKTDGWAAGMILFTERLNNGETDLHFLKGKHPPEEIFEYFAGEICSRTDETIQDFLMKTSFLPVMTAHMAGAVSENSDAGLILSDLSRRNCFTEKRSLEEVSYQYHPLFREYLQTKAKKTFSREDIHKLQTKAADILEDSGQIEGAAMLLTEAGNWERLSRLILSNAQQMASQGRSMTIVEWLNNIPSDMLEQSPWLLYWKGICLMAFDTRGSRGFLEKSFERFKAAKDAAGQFLSLAGIIDTFNYGWEDFSPLDHWIAALEDLLSSNPEMPFPEIEMRVAVGMLSALTNRQPWHPDLPVWAERVQRIVIMSRNVPMQMALGNQLIFYYLWVGDFSKVGIVIDALRPSLGLNEYDPLTRQYWYVMEAMCSWFAADWITCKRAIEDGVKNAEESGIHLFDLYLLAQGVYGGLSLGDPSTADACFEKMSLINSPRTGDKALHHYQASSVAWYHGDLKKSAEHGREAVRICDEIGWPFPLVLCLNELAVTLFDDGKFEEADFYLTKAMEVGHGMIGLEFLSCINGARFAFDRGQEKDGFDHLRRAMALGARYGFLNIPRWNNGNMSRLCAIALEHDIEAGYVRNLIKRRGLVPEQPVGNWPYPIKIYTLGKFEIMKDDKPMEFSGKVQKKPLEFLKVVIAFGGKDVREEQITDLLWPESDGDVAKRSFETTLFRLRKLLGIDNLIELKDGRVSLNEKYCWLDIWAFGNICKQAGELWKNGINKESEALNLSEKALGMYKGGFLPAEGLNEWTASMREKMRDNFMRVTLSAGKYYEQAGQWEKALEYFHKGLETDDLAEGLYQHLMLCHYKLGQKAEALKVYNRCCYALSANLGIEPSEKTEEIYSIIRQGK